MQTNEFNSTNFIIFLWHWKKVLIIVSAIAIALSALFSSPWFIKPKYKSTVVMFPVSTNSISKALLSTSYATKQDIMEFGEQEQAEQMLQILNSSKIKNRVIEKFNLKQHYNIKNNSTTPNTDLYRAFNENISFRRTEFMAVEIKVLDHDPQMAADIANEISNLFDTVKNQMQKERAKEGYMIVEKEYFDYIADMKSKDDSLKIVRENGIFDYESQSERLNEQYVIALAKGNHTGAALIKKELDKLAKYGGASLNLSQQLENQNQQLALLKDKYIEAKVDAERNLPQKFLVDAAFKAEKKSYPIRWLIVIVSTFAAFILTILVIIISETIGGHKEKLKFDKVISENV